MDDSFVGNTLATLKLPSGKHGEGVAEPIRVLEQGLSVFAGLDVAYENDAGESPVAGFGQRPESTPPLSLFRYCKFYHQWSAVARKWP